MAGEDALHLEKLLAGEGGAGFFESIPRIRKMDGIEFGRSRGPVFLQTRENFVNKASQIARTPRTERGMDGNDTVEMDQLAVRSVLFQNLEVGVIHDQSALFHRAEAAVDDDVLASLEDFCQVAEVEPPAADGGTAGFFHEGEEELATAAEADHFRLRNHAAQTNRPFGRYGGESRELGAVLVPPGVMTEEIGSRNNALGSEGFEPGWRDFGDFGEWPSPRRSAVRFGGAFALGLQKTCVSSTFCQK